VSQDIGGDRLHVQGSVPIDNWKLDVCDGVHKLDIAHAMGVVKRYMNNPSKEHSKAVKWILKYLRGSTTQTLCFGGSSTVLQGYVD
jgi:hypothetical protein